MKTPDSESAFTLIELLVVIAIVAILAAVTLPTHSDKRPSTSVVCMMNLRQDTIALIMYAGDHTNRFPMQAAAVEMGGTAESANVARVSSYFGQLHEYLPEPQFLKVLVCPADTSRRPAPKTAALNDTNISYFLNADAQGTDRPSQTVLAGDRDLKCNGQMANRGWLAVTAKMDLDWSGRLHPRGGNLAFADGHAEWNKTNALNLVVGRQPSATNRLIFP